MYMFQYLKQQQNPEQQQQIQQSNHLNQSNQKAISPQRKKLILFTIIILRISAIPLQILFNKNIIDIFSVFSIQFIVVSSVFIIAYIIVLIVHRNYINQFTYQTLLWNLLGFLNILIAAQLFTFQNIIEHDHYFKIKLPIYVIEYLSLMTALYVIMKPFYTINQIYSNCMNPLYNSQYELSSIKYILFGCVIGSLLDCVTFGGNANLIVFYILCGVIILYIIYQVLVLTKISVKFKDIISGQ